MSKNEATLPTHVGLILDGNRRWAKEHGLPTLEGHRQGYDNLKDVVKAAVNRGVSVVSAYIFSTENWSRTSDEVKYLMELAYRMLTRDVNELNQEGIRVVWLGNANNVSEKLQKAIKQAELKTAHNTRGTLAVCFNYGGHDEILDATKKLITAGLKPEEVTKQTFANALYGPDVPRVDLIIRTSGEQRTSGFMLYRSDYAELYFSPKYWPDFSPSDFDVALADYAQRKRRFGK